MPAKNLLTSLAALSALTLAGAAHAAPAPASDPDVATMKVSLAGLDLRSEAGATAALQRIETASKSVCGGVPDVRLLQRRANYSACVKVTLDHAVASLASPRVSAIYADADRSITLVSR